MRNGKVPKQIKCIAENIKIYNVLRKEIKKKQMERSYLSYIVKCQNHSRSTIEKVLS